MIKRLHDILLINTINISALLFADNVPTVTIAENYMKVLVLIITFLYTLLRIIIEIRKYKKKAGAPDE